MGIETQPLISFENKNLDPRKMGGSQIHSLDLYNQDLIKKLLEGKTICVYWSEGGHQRNANDDDCRHPTSVCIKGKLEIKDNVHYRVLYNDDIYSYFNFSDILTVGIREKKDCTISLKSRINN